MMRFFSHHLYPGETAISTVAEYHELREKYVESCAEWWQSFSEDPRIARPETQQTAETRSRLLAEFRHRHLPYVLIARCPFCNAEIWQRAMVFSLEDEFWYRDYGDGYEDIFEPEKCPHLFCVDGALNLNGFQPSEVKGSTESAYTQKYHILMAAEVPFIKPRVLQIPSMVAVIHSLSVADKYTAYPVVYFVEERPPRFHDSNFCVPWAREYYIKHHDMYNFSGRCSDAQEYDLTRGLTKDRSFGSMKMKRHWSMGLCRIFHLPIVREGDILIGLSLGRYMICPIPNREKHAPRSKYIDRNQ